MATRRTEAEIQEIIDRCVEIERRNGDVLEYLRSMNYISPGGTWYNFQREHLGRKKYDITSGKPRKKREERNMGKNIKNDSNLFCELIEKGMDKNEALRKLGSDTPRAAGQKLRQIKAWLKENEPVQYDLMMDRLEKKPEPQPVPEKETVYDDGPAENAMLEDALVLSGRQVMFEAGCMEQEEEPEQEPEAAQIQPAARRPRLKITKIESRFADYTFNDADCQNLLTVNVYTGTDDEEEMELTVDQWETLVDELPEVIRKFTEGA